MRNPNNAAIFVKLHSDPKYMKLHAAKDAANRAWTVSEAYRKADLPEKKAAFKRAMARVAKVELLREYVVAEKCKKLI